MPSQHRQTYQVTCTQCGKEKWPVAELHPVGYICSFCTFIGPQEGAKRRERSKRAAITKNARWRSSQDSTEAAT